MSLHSKQIRRSRAGLGAALMAAAALLAALPAAAQYPGQIADKDKNSGPVLRSVGVLEWTGDLAHPKASRLVPVSLWDGQQLQDAGIYLARPQPLALDSETEYELQKDGKNIGFYDLKEAASQQGAWIGLGGFKPLPSGPTPQQLALAASKQKVDMDDADSDVPILHRKIHADDPGSSKTAGTPSTASSPAPDPDRPTLHKSPDADSSAGKPAGPAPDPDRPRLHPDTNTAGSDPDRPKLHAAPPADEQAHVSNLPDVSDPDRPRLRRGQPAEYGPSAKPTLVGLPADVNQVVAISDARAIKEHSWDYTWANPADESKMKSDLEDRARKALGLDQAAAAPAPKPAARRTSVHRKVVAPPPAEPAPLLDEQFRVLELQYGAGATLLLSAHTAGTGAQQKFVTVIAQPDLYGGVVVLLKHVTDGAHLDLNPRMRLIDAVDALGDNRGELLFELRGQSQREFALYRVLHGQADRIFTSGATYWSAGGE